MLMEETSPLRYFDAACNLVSRRFESDQSRVIDRAEKSLVDAMVSVFASKLSMVLLHSASNR